MSMPMVTLLMLLMMLGSANPAEILAAELVQSQTQGRSNRRWMEHLRSREDSTPHQIWLDRPINTHGRNDLVSHPRIEEIDAYVRDTYVKEPAQHPGLAMVLSSSNF